MGPTEHLHRLGGVAPRAALVALTSRRAVARAVAAGDVLQPSPGRCVLPTADVALRRAVETGGVVSHLSAAAWWGWEIARQPEHPDITVPRHRRVTDRPITDRPITDRRGLHRTDLHPDDVHDGLVTRPERTLLDCLRTTDFPEALAVADSALRHGTLPSTLAVVASSARGPGAPAVRRVAAAASGLAANPFESLLRAHALSAGLDVRPQVTIRVGTESVRPDLVDEARRLVLEADSFAWHGNRAALRSDCGRYNWLVRHGWRVLRFAYEDVMFEAAAVRDLLEAMCTSRWTEVPFRARKRRRTGTSVHF